MSSKPEPTFKPANLDDWAKAAAERGAAEHEGRVIGALDELLTQPRKGGES